MTEKQYKKQYKKTKIRCCDNNSLCCQKNRKHHTSHYSPKEAQRTEKHVIYI